MPKEITQGRIERYMRTSQQIKGSLPLDLNSMGRRDQLKALRDHMSLTRNQLRREGRRLRPKNKYVLGKTVISIGGVE